MSKPTEQTSSNKGKATKIRLNHIGLVSQNMAEFVKIFRLLGLDEVTHPETDPLQKVSASFITADGEVHIEILEPTDDSSPITHFLKKRGAGLHHLCFEVDDIKEIADKLVKEGFQMVCPPVDCAAYDRSFKRRCRQPTKIAFLLLPNKILIEFLQRGQ